MFWRKKSILEKTGECFGRIFWRKKSILQKTGEFLGRAVKTSNTAVKSVIGFGAGTGAVVAVNTVSAGIISTLGFSTGGVVAGSIAAGTQAGIGSVAAGSIFAGLQSLGALGMGILVKTVFPVAAGTGIIFGSIPLIKKWWPKK